MPIAYLAEQFEFPGNLPETLPDVAPEAPAVGTVAELLVTVEALQIANAKLLAEKGDPGVWLPLKAAAADAGVPYETARSWAATKKIESRRDGGRVFVGVNSLIDRLKRLGRRS